MRAPTVAAFCTAVLLVAPAPAAHAQPSVISDIDIPFPVVDATTGCASTGRVRLTLDVTPGLLASESVTARVDSPICSARWSVRVGIIDNAPGYGFVSTAGTGEGLNIATASAAQTVRYAYAGAPVPNIVRGPSRVAFHITWRGSNGVRGCITNVWAVASYAAAYELGPLVPCDESLHIVN